MADKEKKALENEKTEKPAKQEKEKKPSVFRRLGAWFKSLRAEAKKISWASWNSVRSNSMIVIIAVVICSVVIGILDYGFSAAIVGLSRLI